MKVYGTIDYFKNIGTKTVPSFQKQSGSNNPLDGVTLGEANAGNGVTAVLEGAGPAIAVVDINDDGDFDMFIGSNSQGTNGGRIDFFENTGTPTNPSFTKKTGGDNPFNGVTFSQLPNPTSVDVDKDGDMDMFIGTLDGTMQYFSNEGDKDAPLFVKIPGSNPAADIDVGFNCIPVPVDTDNDGIMELYVGNYNGEIKLFSTTRCQPTPACHGRGNCDITTLTESQCQCNGGAFSGNNCESCPSGTLETKYLGGANVQNSLAPQCGKFFV